MQQSNDELEDTTTPAMEALFDGVTHTGDMSENINDPTPEDDEEPPMGEDDLSVEENENKDVASLKSRRTPELRKTIRSGDSGPRDGWLSNATARE